MFNAILEFLKGCYTFVAAIFTTELSALTGYQFVLLILLSIAGLIVLKYVLKAIKILSRSLLKMLKCIFTVNKRRCERTQCRSCGRNLVNCTCEKNKKLSYGARMRLYKRELKKK